MSYLATGLQVLLMFVVIFVAFLVIDQKKKDKKNLQIQNNLLEEIYFFSECTGVPTTHLCRPGENFYETCLTISYLDKNGQLICRDGLERIRSLVDSRLVGAYLLEITIYGDNGGADSHLSGFGNALTDVKWYTKESHFCRRDQLIYDSSWRGLSFDYILPGGNSGESEVKKTALLFIEKFRNCDHLLVEQLKVVLRDKELIPSPVAKHIMENGLDQLQNEPIPDVEALRVWAKKMTEEDVSPKGTLPK